LRTRTACRRHSRWLRPPRRASPRRNPAPPTSCRSPNTWTSGRSATNDSCPAAPCPNCGRGSGRAAPVLTGARGRPVGRPLSFAVRRAERAGARSHRRDHRARRSHRQPRSGRPARGMGSARALPRRRRAVDRRGRLLGPGPPVAPDPAPASQPATAGPTASPGEQRSRPRARRRQPPTAASRNDSDGIPRLGDRLPRVVAWSTRDRAGHRWPGRFRRSRCPHRYLYATCSMQAVATSGAPSHLRRRCWLTPSRRVRGP
jgi:hypothetical protein